MEIQLIRNATMKIAYAGRMFLTDPMLASRGRIKSFAGIERNPTVDLPFPMDEILHGVEAVIVSHVHPDHFDESADNALSRTTPLLCQPNDQRSMEEKGFQTILPIETSLRWGGIAITRTAGRHGTGEMLARMGRVSGFVFQAEGEPTAYWIGDSIWCEEVENALEIFSPEIIITHSGGAKLPGADPIIMDGDQTLKVVDSSPEAVVVAIHMEALDHCTVNRKALRRMADSAGIPSSRLIIPNDGERISF